MISGIRFFLVSRKSDASMNYVSRPLQGFRKIGSDRWEFANEDFLQGKRLLLKKINRHRSSQLHQIGRPTGSSVEKGKSELEGEFQNLRKEKNLLIQEVVTLKQEHLMTVQQMDTLDQRMQSAELRQNQMVSFLAEVLHNPVLFAHLKHRKVQRGITSRIRRKFLKQWQHRQSNLDESMVQQVVEYQLDPSDAASSSAQQSNEGGNNKRSPDHLVQNVVGKLGFEECGREPLGGSDEPGVRMLDPFCLGSDTSAVDGKDLVSFPTDVNFRGTEYLISSLEDITPDEMLSDALVPANESINMTDSKIITLKGKSVMNFKMDPMISGTEYTRPFLGSDDLLQENVGGEVGGTYFNSCHDVWDDLVRYDAQGLEFATGPYALWDLGLHIPEGLEIDQCVGDESSSQEHKIEVGMLNKDHSNDPEP